MLQRFLPDGFAQSFMSDLIEDRNNDRCLPLVHLVATSASPPPSAASLIAHFNARPRFVSEGFAPEDRINRTHKYLRNLLDLSHVMRGGSPGIEHRGFFLRKSHGA